MDSDKLIQGAESLREGLQRVIDYHSTEYTLPYFIFTGILDEIKSDLRKEQEEEDETT